MSEFKGKQQLDRLESAKVSEKDHIIDLTFANGIKGRITFLEETIFRYDVEKTGNFMDYAVPKEKLHTAKIQQRPDDSLEYTHPAAQVLYKEKTISVLCGKTTITWEKGTAKMSVSVHGKPVMEEAEALTLQDDEIMQILKKNPKENFFGGGTQNGRFLHTGKKIRIVNESAWMDGGVSSPNPFYYTTNGYGILYNTFSDGLYDFGEEQEDSVKIIHKENQFSAYYFVTEKTCGREIVQDLLKSYYHITGNPILLPEYGFYEGHLNCYNRDAWSDQSGDKAWNIKGYAAYDSEGITHYESGMASGYRLSAGAHSESLNGEKPYVRTENYPESIDTPYEYSARAVLDEYIKHDMPLGYFLPNDGYGSGYGQNGYYVQGGVNEDGSSTPDRIAALDANVDNFSRFTEYANAHGVASGLWTESNLMPDSNKDTYWHLLRDFKKEVTKGKATTLKTDVAWVGSGYSFQLNGVKTAYDIVTVSEHFRPNIISLDGWAGSQRFNSVWTGDQTGGNWEYIRFHIPTYIGSSLSGNPNIGSDMDGIFGGRPLIAARDYQWKSFTPQMLNMDGWGSYMKAPYTFGDPYTGINRMYMKMKAQLMPYIYTCAASASNIDTQNHDTALPMVRAMFLEYPQDEYTYSRQMQYQFMLGKYLLIAPIYCNVAGDEMGNDVRNSIYLPDEHTIWIDYLTGEKYAGGQILNNFKAPLWKLPIFVKNGAILPMYEENNTPDHVDRKNRIIEFWPYEQSQFCTYEDDGKYIKNQTEQEEAYGVIDHIDYGNFVSTLYTSKVHDDTAILTAERSIGIYNGYETAKNTTFIVHLSEKPSSICAKNGNRNLLMREAETKQAFDTALLHENEAVCFYDEAPKLCTYASNEETQFLEMTKNVKGTPKLYVRFASADASKETQSLEIHGYVNAFLRPTDQVNAALDIPVLRVPEEKKTPSSLWLEWTRIDEADSYEILVDGKFCTMGDSLSFLHDELDYESTHTYSIRARNENGYSKWSDEITATTLLDPWRNEIGALGTVTFAGSDEAGALRYATDHSFKGMFFCADDVVKAQHPFIYDFGAIYELDKFEYYPRDNYGSGSVQKMNIYSSLDGRHWNLEWNGAEEADWTYQKDQELEENRKVVSLDGVSARYLKLIVIKSTRNYFAAHELPVYKKDGTKPFAVGSTNKNETVSAGDYTNMKNYLGTSVKDGSNFVDQIQKRCGDINRNGIYDVYDYAYTMFHLDGGTKQTGSVSGSISLIPDQNTIQAGTTFILTVLAKDVKNLNAFGKVLHYNPSVLKFVSIEQDDAIKSMENLTVNKQYEDNTAYINLAFANRGDQQLYHGNDKLAVLTLQALRDLKVAEEIECEGIWLIGPEFDLVK